MLENPRWKFISEGPKHALLLMSVTQEDENNYEAVAHSVYGRTSSSVCRLLVRQQQRLDGQPTTHTMMSSAPSMGPTHFAPQLVEPLRDVTCSVKERFELKTIVVAEPAAQVQWFFESQPIRPSKYFSMTTPSPNTHVLEIASASLEDRGKYSLSATNDLGKLTIFFKI